jgi:hypothetical protein
MPDSRNLDDPGRRDTRGHVLGDLGRDEGVFGPAEDQGRDADCGQDMPHVDLFVHSMERLE